MEHTETIKQLIKSAEAIDPKIKSYTITYPFFLKHFEKEGEINIQDLIIGISFTYSWMPTILKNINIQNESEILQVLNRAKSGKDLIESDLELLKSAFNNSMVATSKLLHFINPDKFAIWDSRVFRNLYQEEPHKYKLEKPQAYLKYLYYLGKLQTTSNFNQFHAIIRKKVGYKITPLRALELGFYYNQSFL